MQTSNKIMKALNEQLCDLLDDTHEIIKCKLRSKREYATVKVATHEDKIGSEGYSEPSEK
jgi:hypothetical protein